MGENSLTRAEQLFRQALDMYAETLPPDHINTAIGRVKLGRTLLRQKRYHEAEAETTAGYRILEKQVSPSASWMNAARTDLAQIRDALNHSGKAKGN
jgi:serine/threonine-protein kinase